MTAAATRPRTGVDIIHRIGIRAPQERVHAALATAAGVAGWWTEEARGDDRVGGRLEFAFRTPGGELLGGFVMEVRELAPDAIAWRCLEGPAEWIGTDIVFRLSRSGDQTIVAFAHRGWREAVEFTAHCSTKWAVFLLSLRELVETGRGRPSPRDLKIDDWN